MVAGVTARVRASARRVSLAERRVAWMTAPPMTPGGVSRRDCLLSANQQVRRLRAVLEPHRQHHGSDRGIRTALADPGDLRADRLAFQRSVSDELAAMILLLAAGQETATNSAQCADNRWVALLGVSGRGSQD